MKLQLLYRGPLSSCNYGCQYCPFAKHKESRAELLKDRRALERFVRWIGERPASDQFSVLFTPWGEALIRPWYQEAIITLTNLPQVQKVAIQTNLSCGLGWVEQCSKPHLALWATFHPEWVQRKAFVAKCLELDQRGVRFSVGVVGFPRFRAEIDALRQALPSHVYLWINAVKPELPTMSEEELAFFATIDPLFRYNTHHYDSYGLPCGAGFTVVSVAGDGTVRRCHFIPEAIGNLYDPEFKQCLRARPCSSQHCHCHIGYVHLASLKLNEIFGPGILERIPYHLSPYDQLLG
ncbi:MAG: STM4011 family radical SAM protein [Ardenticatenales bacterium]|nr:STM4011 family radical SAM protein [Ardenticatenales bacterium]